MVIDPQRDIDRFEAVLARGASAGALVVETHIHNDYVTGGSSSPDTGAATGERRRRRSRFDRPRSRTVTSSGGPLRVARSPRPGTPTPTWPTRSEIPRRPDRAPAVFTGGSLLFGSVGRTDLVDPGGPSSCARPVPLGAPARDDASRRATVFPTHGFGSFCSSGSARAATTARSAREGAVNDALTEPDASRFVERLIANLTAYPAYYAHMGPANRVGPCPGRLSAPVPRPRSSRSGIEAGEWVVDLRDRVAYAADHAAGTSDGAR